MDETQADIRALFAEVAATQAVLTALIGQMMSAGVAPRVLVEKAFEQAADVAVAANMQGGGATNKEFSQRLLSTVEELRVATFGH